METKILKYILLISLTTFTLSCKKHIPMKEKETEVTQISKLISLSKSSCFGKCPVYKLTIYNDGLAILESKVNMEKLGVFHMKLNEDQLSRLNKKIKNIDWNNSKPFYMKNIPDLPTSTLIFYKEDTTWHKVESNSVMNSELESLHSDLGEYANLKTWIQALKEKEINSLDAIKNELQIDMDTTFDHSHLEKMFSAYNFKVKDRISQYMNFYLYTYDTNKITPAEMVVLARRVKGVRLVSFNKKLQPRDDF